MESNKVLKYRYNYAVQKDIMEHKASQISFDRCNY